MSLRILGMGWATPFGRNLEAVWKHVRSGDVPPVETVEHPFQQTPQNVIRVPSEFLADVVRQPRLRRSSSISHLSMAAATDAVAQSGVDPGKLAVLFAATNGGVIYTRRFFADVSARGAHAGSPLLFPETVYNAPASHIAAALGSDGVCSTLVNDTTAGIDVFAAATELLESGQCEYCLVVGAEETDWVIGDAFDLWSLLSKEDRIRPGSASGTLCAEGAAAMVLGRGEGPAILSAIPPQPFRAIHEGTRLARNIASHLTPESPTLVVSSMGGTRFDAIEESLRESLPSEWLTPKVTLGEVFATSTIQQVVCGAMALREQPAGSTVLVLATGFSGQLAGLALANS